MARGFSVAVNIGARLLPSLNGSINAIERRFAGMNRTLQLQSAKTKIAFKEMAAAASPLLAMAAAGGLTMGLKGIFGEGAEYSHQVSMLRVAGRSVAEVSKGIAQAQRTMMEVPTSTLIDNLKILNETTLAYGNYGHALENLSFNQRMGGMLKLALGDKIGDEGEVFNNLIRAMELRGSALDPKRYQREAGKIFQAMMATGGVVNPEKLLGFVQTANPAVRGYSEDFFTRIVPSLIQEMGGERAGTALTAFNNQILGRVGVGGKTITQEWQRLGLVPANGTADNLSKTGWTPGALKGTDLARSDPLAFVEKYLLPAMAAHGININDSNAVGLEAKKLFGRETAARIASTLLDPTQRMRLHKDQGLFAKALGPDAAYGQAMMNDPRMAAAATAASLKNLETVLGKAVTPQVITALQATAKAINWIAGAFDRHPMFAKGVVALMGFGAATATLAVFNVGLRLVRTNLGGIFGMIGGGLFRAVGFALGRLGPLLLNGLARLAPIVLTGIGEAFALLSNPVGWTVLAVAAAVAAGVLIYKFRDKIGGALKAAWGAISGAFLALPWKNIGWAVADAVTFGLASKLPGALSLLRSHLPAWAGGTPTIAGKRALGGPVLGGRTYLVGEHGPELFTSRMSGHIFSANRTAAMMRSDRRVPVGRDRRGAGSAVGSVTVQGATIIIQDARDPQATARVVRRELERMAHAQAGNMTD